MLCPKIAAMLRILFRSPFSGLIAGFITICGIYFFSDIFGADVFYEKPDPNFKTDIVLVERSQELGLIDLHVGIYPPSRDMLTQSYINLISGVAPAIAVIDINGDGFQDIYTITPGLGTKNKLFINLQGQGFREEAESWGLADVNRIDFSETPQFADVNGDGFPDLILGRSGGHSVYLNQHPQKKFKELANAFGGYRSNTRGFAVLDFDKDGQRDIFMGNYFAPVDLNKEFPPWVKGLPRGDDFYGDKNALLKGTGDGHFKQVGNFDFPYKNHTFYPGIGDFNKDGWPDIFEGNDFSYDRLYYNRKGTYEEVTATDLPMDRHGFAGMNSEVFDFDHDGWLDLYVTNIFGPPFSRRGNLLWRGGPHGFTEISDDMGVRRCGWSWGAKFGDLNLDGKEELIVAGGMVRGEDVHSPQDGELQWYRVSQRNATPEYLRGYVSTNTKATRMNYFGYQRGCLFQWDPQLNKYTDVAPQAGFERMDNSRAFALIDFDNDGRVDFLTGNYNDYLRLYHNKSTAHKKWIGLDLKTREGSNDPVYGARVRLYKGGQLVYYREMYPSNGHRGQNDARLIVAVDEGAGYLLEVKWPDDSLETYDRFETGRYNVILKNKGKKSDAEIAP